MKGLARGPVQSSPAEQMNREVRDGFAGIESIIDDEAEAAFGDAQFSGNLARGSEHAAEERSVFRRGCGDPGNGTAGNDEHMDRRLGIRVMKRNEIIRLKNETGRNLSGGDLFKNGQAREKEIALLAAIVPV